MLVPKQSIRSLLTFFHKGGKTYGRWHASNVSPFACLCYVCSVCSTFFVFFVAFVNHRSVKRSVDDVGQQYKRPGFAPNFSSFLTTTQVSSPSTTPLNNLPDSFDSQSSSTILIDVIATQLNFQSSNQVSLQTPFPSRKLCDFESRASLLITLHLRHVHILASPSHSFPIHLKSILEFTRRTLSFEKSSTRINQGLSASQFSKCPTPFLVWVVTVAPTLLRVLWARILSFRVLAACVAQNANQLYPVSNAR